MLSVLRVFLYAATQALIRLDLAARAEEGAEIQEVARTIARACYLIGEAETGRYLDAVAASEESCLGYRAIPVLRVADASAALTASIARVTALIEVVESGPGVEPMYLVVPAADGRASGRSRPGRHLMPIRHVGRRRAGC